MSQYTPGPWMLHSGTYSGGRELKVTPREHRSSAYVMVGGENADANARLIAQAPAMLAWMRRVMTDCLTMPDSILGPGRHLFPSNGATAEEARTILHTIEGSEP
jgi:hypothetical protein